MVGSSVEPSAQTHINNVLLMPKLRTSFQIAAALAMPQRTLDATPRPAPIYGIPVDILFVIFSMVRTSQGLFNPSIFDLSIHWVPKVTHVCRSWREAALFASALWTDIHVDASTSWAVEFARRSRQAPISIFLETGHDRTTKIYECTKTLLRDNRHRIQEIHLQDIEDQNIIISMLSDDTHTGPALFPILESLKIFHNRDNESSSFFLTNRILHAPKLETLSLKYCSVEEDFGSFHNISHLFIRQDAPDIVTANFLRRALSEMSNLQTLTLQCWDEVVPTSAVDFGIQLASLPKLYHIEVLYWPIEWIISLLQMISYRPRRKLHVTAISVDRLEQVLQLFTCMMLHKADATMHRLGLLYTTAELQVWHMRSPSDSRLSIQFRPRIDAAQLHPHDPVDPTLYLLDGLLRRMNPQDLRFLDLDFKLSNQLWVEIFGKLPFLVWIRIHQGERQFFTALTKAEDVSIHPALPFQTLKVVTVVGRTEPYPENDMEFMVKCLRERNECGLGLKELSFTVTTSGHLKSQLNAFKDVVESLEVH